MKEGGKEKAWTEPDVESGSVFPLCLGAVVYNEQVPQGVSRIQTRSDRKTSLSQLPPLLSPLNTPPLCSLSVFILSVAWSPSLCSLSSDLSRARGSEQRMSAAELDVSVCLRDSGATTTLNGISNQSKSAREIDCLHIT